MLVVSNSSPLIFLAKTNSLELLKNLFEEVHIPRSVYQEVVIEGKKLNHLEVIIIEKAIENGWIIVDEDQQILPLLRNFNELHIGECQAITMAINKKADLILLDDAPARKIAQVLKLNARGTLYTLTLAYEKKLLETDEVKEHLEKLLNVGFRMSPELYAKVLRELEK